MPTPTAARAVRTPFDLNSVPVMDNNTPGTVEQDASGNIVITGFVRLTPEHPYNGAMMPADISITLGDRTSKTSFQSLIDKPLKGLGQGANVSVTVKALIAFKNAETGWTNYKPVGKLVGDIAINQEATIDWSPLRKTTTVTDAAVVAAF